MKHMNGSAILAFIKRESELAAKEMVKLHAGGHSFEEALTSAFITGMMQAYVRMGDFMFDHDNFMETGYNVSPFPKVTVRTASSPEEALKIMKDMEIDDSEIPQDIKDKVSDLLKSMESGGDKKLH